MNDVLLTLFSLSLKASWAALAVLLLRFVLKSAPKWTHCLLWAVVALRLLLPFSAESMLSLVPREEAVQAVVLSGPLHDIIQPEAERVLAENGFEVLPLLAAVWIAGAVGLLLYAVISFFKVNRQVTVSVQLQRGIYLCDDIDKPFILGVFKPRICLPSGMPEKQVQYVIRHERAHLQRRDHWWKPLAFVLIALHWFNPVLWLAYKLFGQDVELACDEATVKDLTPEQRREYSEALLLCGMERKMYLFCPVAFGEIGIQERIVSVLSYRKQAVWRAVTAAAMCVVLAICFLTDPVTASVVEEISEPKPVVEETEEKILPSVEFTDAKYVFALEDSIHVRSNGISVAELKCCPYARSAGMELSYTMSRSGSEELWCRYGNNFHSHRSGYIYGVVRCKNCGYEFGAYYVGRGYYCEFAEQVEYY